MRRKKNKKTQEFSWIFVCTIGFIVMTWLIAIYLTFKSPNNESIFFDAVVALFTGVAFTGVLYSLNIQRQDLLLNREELRINREELSRTHEEVKRQKEELRRQLFDQHFQYMLSTFSKKIDILSETYLTEEYLKDLKLIEIPERFVLSEAEFIAKFTPERLNAIKIFTDLILYYDRQYNFNDKSHSSSLYLVSLSTTAQFSSLLRVVNKLELEHENFAYLPLQLKINMQNALTLSQRYKIVQF